MTTFAKQHARLSRLFETERRPLMSAPNLPYFAGQFFIKRETVPASQGRVLVATCSAVLLDRMFSARELVFDGDVVNGKADVVFEEELKMFPSTMSSVRLLRGWSVEQAEADDAANATLALPTVRYDGQRAACTAAAGALLDEAAEMTPPLAFLRSVEQGLTPDQLAKHIGWLTAHDPLR